MTSTAYANGILRFVEELKAALPPIPSADQQFAWPAGVRRRSVGSLRRTCGRKELSRPFRTALALALKEQGIHCDTMILHAPLDPGRTLAFCRLPFLPEAETASARLAADFGFGLKLAFVTERPQAARQFPVESEVCEDVMQTMLWLHAAEITGEPITIFARSGREWGIADLMGIDSAGRIHLFELKKHTVTAAVASQLTHYLLAHVFEDAERLLAYWNQRFCREVLDQPEMGLQAYLAAALANERLDIWGARFVAQTEGLDKAATEALEKKWDHALGHDQRAEMLMRALRVKVQARRGVEPTQVPTREEFSALAQRWRARLDPTKDLNRQRPTRVRERLVLWLVGPRVAGDALEQIRSWRRAGVDARWLELDVKPVPASLEWDLTVRREWAPHRAALFAQKWSSVEAKLREWSKRYSVSEEDCSVSLDLYDRRSPSDRSEEGGTLKPECRAWACAPGKNSAPLVSLKARDFLRSSLA
jgi:hypothetical protein